MAYAMNLKQIERKAWVSHFEDGLWDIALAMFMLTPAIRTFTDNVWFTLLFAVAPLVLIGGKRFITTPRIGRVKFGRERKDRQRRILIAFGLTILITHAALVIVLGVLNPSETWMRVVTIGLCLGAILGLVAYLLDIPRLYGYFLLLLTGWVLWEAFGDPTGPIWLALSGGVVLTIGIALLLRFLHKYPKLAEEVLDNNV